MTQQSEPETDGESEPSRWHPYTSYQMRHAVRLVIAGLLTVVALVYMAATGQLFDAEWHLIAFLIIVGIGGGLYGSIRVVRWARFRTSDE